MNNQSIKKWIVISLLAFAAGLGYIFLVLPRLQAPAKAQPAPATFQTVPVQTGNITAFVHATGSVRSNQTTPLTWQTSGFVSQVAVAQGEDVPVGVLLGELARTSLPQNVILAQADLVAAQRALDDLRNSTKAQSQAQLALVTAQKALDDARQHRLNLSYRSTADQVAAANANYILAKNEVHHKQETYDHVAGRPEDDAARALALAALENAKKARDKALINLNWYKGKADPKDISQADAAVSVAQSNLDDAQREWDRLKDGPDPSDITAAEAKVDAIQAAINMARITAPFHGTLTLVNNKIGDQVAPGAVAFQIDDLSRLFVDLAVSQLDVDQIQVGQPVCLTLDALPGKTYSGKVTQIALVGKSTAGTVSYTVTVEITQKGPEVRPGMTINASIAAAQVKGALLVPNASLLVQGGKTFIYLLRSGNPHPVSVTPGLSAGNDVQVIAGKDEIHPGDRVLVNPASQP